MKQGKFEIIENIPLTDSVYKMTLRGDVSAITAPGQFVNISLEGLYLRRPISVCDVAGDCLTIIYKVVGKGTAQMAQMKEGTLDVLTGLGNGYDLALSGDRPVLLGGGVCAQGDNLVKPLQKLLDRDIFAGELGPQVSIRIAELGNSAGLLGAAALWM